MTSDRLEVELIEIDLLLEALRRRYGYDFRGYSRPSLTRRIHRAVEMENLATISDLQRRVLHDADCMSRLITRLSVHATAMFRDPAFYRDLRTKVVPILRTYPFIRIWHAGCATGEEVFSLAIVLSEEGLLPRSRLYATDIAEGLLERASAGIFSLQTMQDSTRNYHRAGGRREFSSYYESEDQSVRFREDLTERMVFAGHNLVTDGPFNEFNLILCRNVMLYFSGELRERVHGLLYDSLVRLGFLGLGSRESLALSQLSRRYGDFLPEHRVYRKVS